MLLRGDQRIENTSNGAVLAAGVLLDKCMNRRDTNVLALFLLERTFERCNGVRRGKACQATRGDLAHTRIVVEQHGNQRFPPTRILDCSKQWHDTRTYAVVRTLERLDHRQDSTCADDRETGSRGVDTPTRSTTQTRDQLSDLVCP